MILTDFFRISSISRNNKIIFFTFSVVIVALIVDTSIIKISDLVGSPQNGLPAFVIIATAYAIAQYIILKFIKTKSNEIRSKEKGLHLNVIHKIVTTVQYLLTAILIFVICTDDCNVGLQCCLYSCIYNDQLWTCHCHTGNTCTTLPFVVQIKQEFCGLVLWIIFCHA